MYSTSKWQTALFHPHTFWPRHCCEEEDHSERTNLGILKSFADSEGKEGRKAGRRCPQGDVSGMLGGSPHICSWDFLRVHLCKGCRGSTSSFSKWKYLSPIGELLVMHTSTSSGHSEGWVGAGNADKLHQGPWGTQILKHTQGNPRG